MLLRRVAETPYHGTGPKWLPGAEREVDEARGAWLLLHFPDDFARVGASPPAPTAPDAIPAVPARMTKPARGRQK